MSKSFITDLSLLIKRILLQFNSDIIIPKCFFSILSELTYPTSLISKIVRHRAWVSYVLWEKGLALLVLNLVWPSPFADITRVALYSKKLYNAIRRSQAVAQWCLKWISICTGFLSQTVIAVGIYWVGFVPFAGYRSRIVLVKWTLYKNIL